MRLTILNFSFPFVCVDNTQKELICPNWRKPGNDTTSSGMHAIHIVDTISFMWCCKFREDTLHHPTSQLFPWFWPLGIITYSVYLKIQWMCDVWYFPHNRWISPQVNSDPSLTYSTWILPKFFQQHMNIMTLVSIATKDKNLHTVHCC